MGITSGKYDDLLTKFARSAGSIPLDVEKSSQLLNELKGLGFNDDQLVDSCAVVAAFAFYTRIVDATGHKLPPDTPNKL